MDRITALRNIENALSEYEDNDRTLPELEREVRGILRTYATEFDDGTAFRAHGDPSADGIVVVATSRTNARERIEELLAEPHETTFTVEPLD